MQRRFIAAAVLAAAMTCGSAAAAEFTIGIKAVEQAIRDEYFSVNNRHYLVGSPETECLYSFLEQPRLTSDGGRLRLDMQFRAMIGTDAFGDCRGITDEMPVTVTLTPFAEGSTVGARDVRIDLGGRDDESARMVRDFLQQEITRAARIDLAAEIGQLLANNRNKLAFKLSLTSLRVKRLELTARDLVLDVDFALAAQ